jgi:hypothetical protein
MLGTIPSAGRQQRDRGRSRASDIDVIKNAGARALDHLHRRNFMAMVAIKRYPPMIKLGEVEILRATAIALVTNTL